MAGRFSKNIHALRIACAGVHKEQVLPDRSREKLGILSHETDPLPQPVQIDIGALEIIIEYLPRLRRIQADQ